MFKIGDLVKEKYWFLYGNHKIGMILNIRTSISGVVATVKWFGDKYIGTTISSNLIKIG